MSYRITQCEPIENDNYIVGIHVEYNSKYKYFQTIVMTLSTSEVDIVAMAWALLKDKVDTWKLRVQAGEFIQGRLFTPQDDGTIVLVPE